MEGTAPGAIVFLDVDGVIVTDGQTLVSAERPVRHRVWLPAHKSEVVIHYSPFVVAGLRDLATLPDVEFRWLTTWQQDAPEALGPAIGLGESWDACGLPVGSDPWPALNWWKADEVRWAVNSGRRVVWVDDDITLWISVVQGLNAEERLAWMDTKALLSVCPSTKFGLEAEHLNAIRRFVHDGERPTP